MGGKRNVPEWEEMSADLKDNTQGGDPSRFLNLLVSIKLAVP